MYRDIFTNKWIIGGFCFLILFSVLCYFYYQHTTAGLKEQTATVKESNREKTAATVKSIEQTGDAPVESITPTAEKTTTQTPAEVVTKDNTTSENKAVTNSIQTTTPKKAIPVRMSPHGFGPYPEIPEGAPIAIFEESDSRTMELLGRVMVKAWNEGERFEGGVIDSDTGKVYLNYADVIYVEYSEDIDDQTGEKEMSISDTMTGANLSDNILISIHQGNIPEGYRLIDYNEAGINPYEYLDLP